MISPQEHYFETYQALDTVQHDLIDLRDTHAELDAECEDDTDRAILAEEAAADRREINHRRNHILKYAIGQSATMYEIREAGLQYLAQFEDNEERELAAKRVSIYNNTLSRVRRDGALTPGVEALSLDPTDYTFHIPEQPADSQVKLHGRRDPETGKLWLDPQDPRTVEDPRLRIGSRTVANYRIASRRTDENGHEIVLCHTVSGGFEVDVTENPRKWRFDAENPDVLELYIPANSSSLMPMGAEASRVTTIEQEVAVAAAGGPQQSIFATYGRQYGNPVPMPVAKTQ